jgi:hypothetical protein
MTIIWQWTVGDFLMKIGKEYNTGWCDMSIREFFEAFG